MTKTDLYVLFAQPRCDYFGQHPPVAIGCVTEYEGAARLEKLLNEVVLSNPKYVSAAVFKLPFDISYVVDILGGTSKRVKTGKIEVT